jgi:hypothetical protein
MDGTFTYNVDEWQPEVEYSESGGAGTLTISHEGENIPVGGELVNDWDLQFNNGLPLEILIETGAGESVLDFSALDITAATVDAGAGATTIDLTGNWSHDVSVTVRGGVGDITINLPADMGVRVNSDTALVSVTATGLTRDDDGYSNDALGTAPFTLTLDLEVGVGSVVLAAAES